MLPQCPRRIAFVTTTPLSIEGGSGTFVGIQGLAASLKRRSVGVDLLAPRRPWRAYTAQRILYNWLVTPRLRAPGYDWVVGFDLDGFHYGRAPVAPYVASVKGVIADELTNERGWVKAMLRVQASFERLAVQRARVVVATSRYSRDRILEAYGIGAGKIVVVPEAVDLAAWGAPGAVEIAEPPAILTVAHLYPRKNLGTLLRACARLERDRLAFQCWVVGEGPCRRAWERERDALRLRESVRFLGTTPRAELRRRYAGAAIFCLPSRQEGFGIVFLEAMASGLPVVAGRAAAVPEVVLDGETGVLVDPRDPDALAEALAGLLRDTSRRRALGEAGRRRAETYRADAVAECFVRRVGAALVEGAAPPATEEAHGMVTSGARPGCD